MLLRDSLVFGSGWKIHDTLYTTNSFRALNSAHLISNTDICVWSHSFGQRDSQHTNDSRLGAICNIWLQAAYFRKLCSLLDSFSKSTFSISSCCLWCSVREFDVDFCISRDVYLLCPNESLRLDIICKIVRRLYHRSYVGILNDLRMHWLIWRGILPLSLAAAIIFMQF